MGWWDKCSWFLGLSLYNIVILEIKGLFQVNRFLDLPADICHDPNQLLFQQCTFQSKGESQCDRNVAKIFKHTSCRLHVELPSSMNRPDVKKDLQDAEERAK